MPPKPKGGRKGISDEDRHSMLAAVNNKPRDYAILCCVWETACRRNGAAGLKIQDLNIEHKIAMVTEKGDKTSEVYFTDRTVDAMNDWFRIRGENGYEYIFLGRRGPLTKWGIYDVFEKAAIAAGFKNNWSPHPWRHARARYWLKKWMNLALVSQLLGHANISVTVEHYGIFATNELEKAYRAYSGHED